MKWHLEIESKKIEKKSKETASKEMLTGADRHKITVSLPKVVLKKQKQPHEVPPFTTPNPLLPHFLVPLPRPIFFLIFKLFLCSFPS